MRAAVVHSPDLPPAYTTYTQPDPSDGLSLIKVLASPLSPIVRSLAAGKHYSAGGDGTAQGFVPGVDGVGINAAGERVYFLFPVPPFGSMAEYSLVATSSTMKVPEGVASERAAAVVTGGLSSWVALHDRAEFVVGESVLVNGATGSAGSLAVQIARHLGARRIVATGRDEAKLAAFADDVETIALDRRADDRLRQAFREPVDIVLDYLWGEPAGRVIAAATHGRGSRAGEPRLRYVQLGSIAGETIPLDAAAFRSSGLEILGSGIGSVSMSQLVAGAGALLAAIPVGRLDTPVRIVPLSRVQQGWTDRDDDARIVFTPGS